MPREDCKKRCNLLRERFNKEQKKQELASGNSPLPYEEEWPYLDSMMFIKNFIHSRNYNKIKLRRKSNWNCRLQRDSFAASETPKEKIEPFGDTCNVFKEAIADFRERQNDLRHFLQSKEELIKDLPEDMKGRARIDILSYVTSLRTQQLGT